MLSLLSLPRCRAKLFFSIEFATWPSRKYSLPAWRIRQQKFRRPTNPEHEPGWTFNHKNRIGYHKVPWRTFQKTRDIHHIEDDQMRVLIHKLLWVLRHAGPTEGLNVRLDGFIRIDELVSRDIIRFIPLVYSLRLASKSLVLQKHRSPYSPSLRVEWPKIPI